MEVKSIASCIFCKDIRAPGSWPHARLTSVDTASRFPTMVMPRATRKTRRYPRRGSPLAPEPTEKKCRPG